MDRDLCGKEKLKNVFSIGPKKKKKKILKLVTSEEEEVHETRSTTL